MRPLMVVLLVAITVLAGAGCYLYVSGLPGAKPARHAETLNGVLDDVVYFSGVPGHPTNLSLDGVWYGPFAGVTANDLRELDMVVGYRVVIGYWVEPDGSLTYGAMTPEGWQP